MTTFDGSSPALVFHLRAAIIMYLKRLDEDLALANEVMAEDVALAERQERQPRQILSEKVDNVTFQIDEAKTAFARLPFTIKPHPDYL